MLSGGMGAFLLLAVFEAVSRSQDCTVVAHCILSSSCASILVLWRLSDASISSNIFDNRYMHTRSGTLCAFYIWRLFPIPAPHYRKTFVFCSESHSSFKQEYEGSPVNTMFMEVIIP